MSVVAPWSYLEILYAIRLLVLMLMMLMTRISHKEDEVLLLLVHEAKRWKKLGLEKVDLVVFVVPTFWSSLILFSPCLSGWSWFVTNLLNVSIRRRPLSLSAFTVSLNSFVFSLSL
jgi:hypothetical protein